MSINVHRRGKTQPLQQRKEACRVRAATSEEQEVDVEEDAVRGWGNHKRSCIFLCKECTRASRSR